MFSLIFQGSGELFQVFQASTARNGGKKYGNNFGTRKFDSKHYTSVMLTKKFSTNMRNSVKKLPKRQKVEYPRVTWYHVLRS